MKSEDYSSLLQPFTRSVQSQIFEELFPFIVRGCKDKREYFPAKSFLKVYPRKNWNAGQYYVSEISFFWSIAKKGVETLKSGVN
ncbi:MAG: hypothetical protein DI535_24970 [Citrobacter freundii]|nr:MAG: hypothetical protein DI535_24970 [Citrobacter freundii]